MEIENSEKKSCTERERKREKVGLTFPDEEKYLIKSNDEVLNDQHQEEREKERERECEKE